MDCRDVAPLVDAFVDGELEPGRRAAVAAHMLSCVQCRRLVDETRDLVQAIRAEAPYHRAPAGLAERIEGAVAAPAAAPARARGWRPWALAASFAAVALLSSAATYRLTVPSAGDLLVDELIAGHVRSLMVDHLSDVASSDQHTVKPWFNGKLDLAPPVKDLAARGFPLAGGRLDYVGGRPVAALVYRHRQHVINLFIAPAEPRGEDRAASIARQGYNVLSWSEGGLRFWAVSDLAAADLDRFRTLIREPGD